MLDRLWDRLPPPGRVVFLLGLMLFAWFVLAGFIVAVDAGVRAIF